MTPRAHAVPLRHSLTAPHTARIHTGQPSSSGMTRIAIS